MANAEIKTKKWGEWWCRKFLYESNRL